MNKKSKLLITSIVFPILALMLLTAYKHYKVNYGKEIIIPIRGFDPRNLLSGHYLIYQLDLNIANYSDEDHNKKDVYLGVNQLANYKVRSTILHNYHAGLNSKYDIILKGSFKRNRFTSGIERFYIPEKYSRKLDRVVRNRQGKIIVSVDSKGKAYIKDLLINNKSWREFVKEE